MTPGQRVLFWVLILAAAIVTALVTEDQARGVVRDTDPSYDPDNAVTYEGDTDG